MSTCLILPSNHLVEAILPTLISNLCSGAVLATKTNESEKFYTNKKKFNIVAFSVET